MLFAERFQNIEVPDDSKVRAGSIARALQARGIFVKILKEIEGPTSRTYEIQLGVSARVSNLRRVLEDLAIQMSVPAVHLSYVDNRLYLEVPRRDRVFPTTREVYSRANTSQFNRGEFIVGVTSSGKILKDNIANLPHLIVAGAPGSGKRITLHNLLTGWMYTHYP